jgi:hypothetical protein
MVGSRAACLRAGPAIPSGARAAVSRGFRDSRRPRGPQSPACENRATDASSPAPLQHQCSPLRALASSSTPPPPFSRLGCRPLQPDPAGAPAAQPSPRENAWIPVSRIPAASDRGSNTPRKLPLLQHLPACLHRHPSNDFALAGFPTSRAPKKRSAPIPLSRRDPSPAGTPLPPAPLPPVPSRLPSRRKHSGRAAIHGLPDTPSRSFPGLLNGPRRPPRIPSRSPRQLVAPRRPTHGPTSLPRPPSTRQGSFPHPPSRGSSGRREGRCLDVDWRGACERGKRFAFVAREFNFAGGLRAGFCCREDFHGNKTSNIDSYL